MSRRYSPSETMRYDSLWDNGEKLVYESPVEYIAFNGGGVKGIAYAGVIKALIELDLVKNVKVWSGTSIGSIAMLLITSGVPLDFIEEYLFCIKTEDVISKNWFSKMSYPSNLVNLFYSMGLDDGDKVLRLVEKILEKACLPVDITLKEYYKKTGKYIVPSVSSINTNGGETLYLSPSLYPDFPVAHAVRISSCFPIAFSPQLIKDRSVKDGVRCLLDGGLYENCPIAAFDLFDADDKLAAANRRAVAFYFLNYGQQSREYEDVKSFKDYGSSLLNSMHSDIQKHVTTRDYFWQRIIPIECKDVRYMSSDMTYSDKEKLANTGYLSTMKYFKERSKKIKEEGFPDSLFVPSYKAKCANIEFSDEDVKHIRAYSVNINRTSNCLLKHNFGKL